MTSDFVVAYACLRIFVNILGGFFLKIPLFGSGVCSCSCFKKAKVFQAERGKGLSTSQLG